MIVGFVGLGVMGGRIAKRLMDAGHTLIGYNRTRSRAQWLVDAGLTLADTPREVAERCEVTFSMVTGTDALQAITAGEHGILAGLSEGKLYIDMTTATPSLSRQIANEVSARGARMLDAPVSGSVITLEEGRLSIMVGGDAQDLERVRPLLESIGPRVTHVGGNGQAALMKIATNLSLAVQMIAFSEGVLLAEKAGIPRATAVEVLVNSAVASPMVKYRGPFVLGLPDEAWFDVNMMQKDLLLALEAGRELNVPLPTTALATEWMTAARALGLEKEDFAVVFEAMRLLSGGR